jgi:nucleoside-diphosphate-sugar epimerase
MTVLVTGATGCIGHALAARLSQSRDFGPVRALVRPGSDTRDLPPGIEIVSGTLEDGPDALQAAVRGVEIIFHAAAKVHDPMGSAEGFRRINVEGTQNLLDACNREGVAPRLIFYSTVAVYGETTPPEGIPEDAPVKPTTPYAESKVTAEEIIREWGKTKGTNATIFRTATVYGPRDRGNMARMMAAIARGRFLLPGAGKNRKTCIATENVVRASIQVLRLPVESVAGQTFLLADPNGPYTLRELAAAMAEAAGIRRGVRSMPVAGLLALSGGLEAVLGARSPLARKQVLRLAANNVYLPTKSGQIYEGIEAVPMSYGMVEAARWLKSTMM